MSKNGAKKTDHHYNIHPGLLDNLIELDLIDLDPENTRMGHDVLGIAQSLSDRKIGQRIPVILRPNPDDEKRYILEAGEGRVKAARLLGWTHIAGLVCEDDEQTAKAFAIADNLLGDKSQFNNDLLMAQLEDMGNPTEVVPGVTDEWLEAVLAETSKKKAKGSRNERDGGLFDKFLIPPFSILDSGQGYWQDRKRQWKSLGIDGGAGRETAKASGSWGREGLHNIDKYRDDGGQVLDSDGHAFSFFDPVLCEIAMTWFAPKGGLVCDPFAGGPTAGIVAGVLGYEFMGVDIRQEQVEANREIMQALKESNKLEFPFDPLWVTGDSAYLVDVLKEAKVDGGVDLLFSCPPYFDLEVYSDLDQDLSTATTYTEFIGEYHGVIAQGVEALDPNRFAVFVVGDIRDEHGMYHNFVSDTIDGFERAGARLYNEAILVTVAGSLPMRVGRYFARSRKLGKRHQNVLVFVKGDPVEAVKHMGPVEIWQPKESELI